MKSLSFPAFGLTLAAGLLALSACGQSDNGSPKAASPVVGKAAPAGTVWSEQIVETPDGGYRMGNPDAPLKLIGFASYTCSHCAKFAQEGEAPLIKDYVDTGKLSYEFRNFVRDPLDIAVALLARCNGKASFFPLSNQLFANQPQMFSALEAKGEAAQQAAMNAPPAQRFAQLAALGNVIEFVKQRGLTEDKARACLADLDAATALVQNVEKANGNWSIKGTPAFVLNGALLEDTAEWEALSKHLKDAGG